jgi:hypothetical protein
VLGALFYPTLTGGRIPTFQKVIKERKKEMETLIFLSPFAIFFLIIALSYFHLNSLAIFTSLSLLVWVILVPAAALLAAENKKK